MSEQYPLGLLCHATIALIWLLASLDHLAKMHFEGFLWAFRSMAAVTLKHILRACKKHKIITPQASSTITHAELKLLAYKKIVEFHDDIYSVISLKRKSMGYRISVGF
jgi:hypothetical protein